MSEAVSAGTGVAVAAERDVPGCLLYQPTVTSVRKVWIVLHTKCLKFILFSPRFLVSTFSTCFFLSPRGETVALQILSIRA